MAAARRIVPTTGKPAPRPRRSGPVKVTPNLPAIPDLGGILDGVTKRGSLDLTLVIVPHLGDLEAARALAAEYARSYAEVSGVEQPEPLADLAGIQARVADAIRSGIAEVLGRAPFVSIVDEGSAVDLPDPPKVTAENLSTVLTPESYLEALLAVVLLNNTRRTRIGISTGTDGPPRDRDVLAADVISMTGPELSEDGSKFAAGFGVVVRPSFVLALANTLLTPLSLDGNPCECGPIVLSNPRVTMADGRMTDRVDATVANAITATVTLVDQVRVLHGFQSSSITGRVDSTDVAVKPITARAKKLEAEAWRNAFLAMVAPPHLGRMAVRGILGRVAEHYMPALPSPIAMLGAALPFGPRPLAPSFDAQGNPIPSAQTLVLGARHLDGTTALKADITSALRVSGLVQLRPRQASVAINVQVRDSAHREFSVTASDVEMIDPSFTWTITGATVETSLEAAEVHFRAAQHAVVQLHVTAAGTDGLTTEADLTLDVDVLLKDLTATPTT
ncbi:MAG: hypothetical protein K1X87_09645 [Dehalococcoidia bacterium]|nr:hypothetical protein [Dehalococcoidia bacterium]